MQKHYTIALEGLIGVGKSTFCARIGERTARYTLHCVDEPVNGKMLQLFYGAPRTYGFTMQWGMLLQRLARTEVARQTALLELRVQQLEGTLAHVRALPNENVPDVPQAAITVLDRSVLGDFLFALLNYALGNLTRDLYDTYLSELTAHIELDAHGWPRPKVEWLHHIYYLVDEVGACARRVQLQRSKPEEAGIPLAYYQALDDLHFELLIRRCREVSRTHTTPVTLLPFADHCDLAAPALAAIIDQTLGTSNCGRWCEITCTTPPMSTQSVYVLPPLYWTKLSLRQATSVEDICAELKLLKTDTEAAAKSARELWIPADGARIELEAYVQQYACDTADKELDVQHMVRALQEVDLAIWCAEFKKLVLHAFTCVDVVYVYRTK